MAGLVTAVRRPFAVDAFCGAGGASEGLRQAGYDVLGFDQWQPAVDTHNANGMPARLHDLSDASLDHLIPDCDLMWLSPPCQPFSAAGDGEGEFDERDGFPWALRILGKVLPPVAIIENVKGLTFAKHAEYFGGVLRSLSALGYVVDWCVLNAADVGVPQTRERCIIVARRDGGRIVWPTVTHTEQAGMFTEAWVTMADALGWGLPTRPAYAIIAGNGKDSADPIASSWVRDRLKSERDAGRWILDYRQTNRTGEPIFCDVTDRPCPTIGTQSPSQWIFTRPATTIAGDTRVFQPGGHHQPGEQSQNAIRLSIAELARLQDFPADWIWTGTKTQQARMIGNAVPPTLARVVAEANMPIAARRAA